MFTVLLLRYYLVRQEKEMVWPQSHFLDGTGSMYWSCFGSYNTYSPFSSLACSFTGSGNHKFHYSNINRLLSEFFIKIVKIVLVKVYQTTKDKVCINLLS